MRPQRHSTRGFSRAVGPVARVGVVLTLLGTLATTTGVFAAITDSADTGVSQVDSSALPALELGSLGDRVWADVDHDGIQDLDEAGVAGVTVTLLDESGAPVTTSGLGAPLAPVATDGAGTYGFTDLAPATYLVRFSALPTGARFTYQGSVPGDGTDSDVDPDTGTTGPVAVASGDSQTGVDAGLWTPAPGLSIEKRAEGADADTAPGPSLPVGDTVTFDYLVTNTGNEPLVDLAVTDDRGVVVTCPHAELGRRQVVACSGTAEAVDGPYTNVGTATAIGADSGETAPSAQDSAHYTGVEPLLSLEKSVNGSTADSAADPVDLDIGGPVTFTFRVENTGTETIGAITLTDGATAVLCPRGELGPGETMECDPMGGVAVAGLHTNVASVAGTGAETTLPAAATDSASYFGRDRRLSFLKEALDPVSGGYLDADADPGSAGSNDGVLAVVASGGTGHFRFSLANLGNEPLPGAIVSDPGCDAPPALVSGDGDPVGSLDVGEAWVLACRRSDLRSSFVNTASATAGGITAVERASTAVVTGTPEVRIAKSVFDPHTQQFVDEATISLGDGATFRIRVTNTGERDLADIAVSDPQALGCERALVGVLTPGETEMWTCERNGLTEGFTNRASVRAQPVGGGARVRAHDTASVLVVDPTAPDLAITKELADQSGDLAVWRLQVTNHGPGPVAGPVTVRDDLPAELTYVSGVGGGFTCSALSRLVDCVRTASLPDGAVATITLTTRIVATAPTTITNQAQVLAAFADARADNNVDSSTVAAPGTGGGGPGGTIPGDPGPAHVPRPADPGQADGLPDRDVPYDGPLPVTGADEAALVILGMCLSGIGIVLLWGVARRRRAEERAAA